MNDQSLWNRYRETQNLCPDEMDLAAFADGSLEATRHEQIDLHIATCDECSETLALLFELKTESLDTVSDLAVQAAVNQFTPRRRSLRWITAAAVLIILALPLTYLLRTPSAPPWKPLSEDRVTVVDRAVIDLDVAGEQVLFTGWDYEESRQSWFGGIGSDGNVAWDRVSQFPTWSFGTRIAAAGSDVLVATDVAPADGGNASDTLIARYDRDGNPLWATRFSGPSIDSLNVLQVTSDEGCIVVGVTGRPVPNTVPEVEVSETDDRRTLITLMIAKLDRDGQREWIRYYRPAVDIPNHVRQHNSLLLPWLTETESGYLVATNILLTDRENDVWTLALDLKGDVLNSHVLGSPAVSESAWSLHNGPDGILLSGWQEDTVSRKRTPWFVPLDDNGTPQSGVEVETEFPSWSHTAMWVDGRIVSAGTTKKDNQSQAVWLEVNPKTESASLRTWDSGKNDRSILMIPRPSGGFVIIGGRSMPFPESQADVEQKFNIQGWWYECPASGPAWTESEISPTVSTYTPPIRKLPWEAVALERQFTAEHPQVEAGPHSRETR